MTCWGDDLLWDVATTRRGKQEEEERGIKSAWIRPGFVLSFSLCGTKSAERIKRIFHLLFKVSSSPPPHSSSPSSFSSLTSLSSRYSEKLYQLLYNLTKSDTKTSAATYRQRNTQRANPATQIFKPRLLPDKVRIKSGRVSVSCTSFCLFKRQESLLSVFWSRGATAFTGGWCYRWGKNSFWAHLICPLNSRCQWNVMEGSFYRWHLIDKDRRCLKSVRHVNRGWLKPETFELCFICDYKRCYIPALWLV